MSRIHEQKVLLPRGVFITTTSRYRQNLTSCLEAIDQAGGTLVSVTKLGAGFIDTTWVVVYEAKEPVGYEELT